MPVNPRSLANLLPMPHLESGVTSEVHRVRAATEVQAWFRSLTAEQRGDVLARVMVAEAPAGAALEGITTRRSAIRERPVPLLPVTDVLWVVSHHVPQRLKNDLRWSPERYAALEALLASAGTLTLHRTNGKTTWRTSDGQTIRKDTVQRLYGAGVLARTV